MFFLNNFFKHFEAFFLKKEVNPLDFRDIFFPQKLDRWAYFSVIRTAMLSRKLVLLISEQKGGKLRKTVKVIYRSGRR